MIKNCPDQGVYNKFIEKYTPQKNSNSRQIVLEWLRLSKVFVLY